MSYETIGRGLISVYSSIHRMQQHRKGILCGTNTSYMTALVSSYSVLSVYYQTLREGWREGWGHRKGLGGWAPRKLPRGCGCTRTCLSRSSSQRHPSSIITLTTISGSSTLTWNMEQQHQSLCKKLVHKTTGLCNTHKHTRHARRCATSMWPRPV